MKMKLEDKNVVFLGDSITYGYGLEDVKYRFSDILKKELNLKSAGNYGISGTRIARQLAPNPNAAEDQLDFCARYTEMKQDADVIVIFGGVNDYQHGDAPMGNSDDRTPDTFCGALNFLYSNLRKRYPLGVIVVITPMHMLGDKKPGGIFSEAEKPFALEDYVHAIKEAAANYNYPILDMFSHRELDPNDSKIKLKYVPDGIHPNADGHRMIANLLSDFLKKL